MAYAFNVLTMVCKNSSRTFEFLCLKQGVNFSSNCCGGITWYSMSFCRSDWAFSRTVSLLSPRRSTTCGRMVGVYAAKSGPRRLMSSINASSARCAIFRTNKINHITWIFEAIYLWRQMKLKLKKWKMGLKI